jgi:SHS2 domain-containing protein
VFEVLPHTADVGLRVTASTLSSLFEDAGCGFFSLIVEQLLEIRPRQQKHFELSGGDVEYLLFDWLNELLFTFELERMLFCEFQVSIDSEGLRATARGEQLDPTRHHLTHEIKAITYHGLRVVRNPGGWLAEVIVDI